MPHQSLVRSGIELERWRKTAEQKGCGDHLENSDGRRRGDYSSICVETRERGGPGWPMGRQVLDNGDREAFSDLESYNEELVTSTSSKKEAGKVGSRTE